MLFRAQNIFVHEGKMRHVEKVLDHPKARRTHLHPTAGHKAAIRFARLRNIENLPLRLAERGPDAAIALAKRQCGPALAVVLYFRDDRQTAVIAEQLDILPEQPRADD